MLDVQSRLALILSSGRVLQFNFFGKQGICFAIEGTGRKKVVRKSTMCSKRFE